MNWYRVGTVVFIIAGSIVIGFGTNFLVGIGAFVLSSAIVTAERVD